MYLVKLIIIIFASTADSFIIGFNYGLKKIRINNISNLYIALVTCIGTFLSMQFGRLINSFLSTHQSDMIGGAVLIGLAVYMLKSTFFPQKGKIQDLTENPAIVDTDHSSVIELRESLVIGIRLCIKNIGMGVGAGITGMPSFLTSFLCAVASFIFIRGGSVLGNLIHTGKISKYLEVISALLVLCLGILGFCS